MKILLNISVLTILLFSACSKEKVHSTGPSTPAIGSTSNTKDFALQADLAVARKAIEKASKTGNKKALIAIAEPITQILVPSLQKEAIPVLYAAEAPLATIGGVLTIDADGTGGIIISPPALRVAPECSYHGTVPSGTKIVGIICGPEVRQSNPDPGVGGAGVSIVCRNMDASNCFVVLGPRN